MSDPLPVTLVTPDSRASQDPRSEATLTHEGPTPALHAPPTHEGRTPQPEETLPPPSQPPPAELTLMPVPPLLADQERRWQRGDKVRVEAYLQQHASLRADSQGVLRLIANEIALRQRHGDTPPADEYQRRFPEYASELGLHFTKKATQRAPAVDETLTADRVTPKPTPTPSFVVPTPQPGGSTPHIVGDYEVQSVLGRGGMGVVYKAWQKGLNRLVALKMILGGAHAGSEDLTRFRIEAEAAARLHHPNIIQIYDVGEHQERPYLALEYVDGGSLAERLDGTPLPPRQAAELLETLARAMHHAHERGVVHRDLKPGNILLTGPKGKAADGMDFGQPKITDFGLAKRLDIDMRQTQTGAILGTPSYMAPEQASGRIHAIGPGTDVYALGAVLYDLLTGRPPFKSTTLADTLHHVQNTEPVSPVHLQPGVPRDLATICLKCLRKEIPRRYPSAEALAEDLRRFLAGEPILARPTPAWERAYKWARRRPAAAALILVSTVAAVSLLAGSLVYNGLLTAANKREAAQRRQAEENFGLALNAVDDMLTEVGAVDLADVPQMEAVRRRILNKALALFETFPQESNADPALRREVARAQGRLGDIQEMLGDVKKAEPAYGEAVAGLHGLLADLPGDPRLRRELARDLNNRGVLRKKQNRFPEAEDDLRQALLVRAELAHDQPADRDSQRELATTRYNLATVLARQDAKRQEAAEPSYLQALELQKQLAAQVPDQPEYQRDVARTLNNLGILLKPTRRRDEAAKFFGAAVALQEQLAAHYPDVTAYRRELARSYHNLAMLLWESGKRLAATEAFKKGIARLERLSLDFPGVPEYRYELATFHSTWGEQMQLSGLTEEGEAAFGMALRTLTNLVNSFPRPDFRHEQALVYLSLGRIQRLARRTREEEVAYRQARDICAKLVAEFPAGYLYLNTLSHIQFRLADLLFARSQLLEPAPGLTLILVGASGRVLDAVGLQVGVLESARKDRGETLELLQQALAFQRRACDAQPHNLEFRKQLRNLYFGLAQIQRRLKNHAAVAQAAVELPRILPDDDTQYVAAAEFLGWSAQLSSFDQRLPEDQRKEVGSAYCLQAVTLLRAAVQKGYRNLQNLKTNPAFLPLRDRADFKKVLQSLEEKAGGAVA